MSVLELLFLDLLGENKLANHSLVLDFDSKLGVLLFNPATSGLSKDPFDDCGCPGTFRLDILPPTGAKLTILKTVSIGSMTEICDYFDL